jgi:hypothetical protein
MTFSLLRLHSYDCYRGKHEVYDRLLTGTPVDFQ